MDTCDTYSDEGGADPLCQKDVALLSCECPQDFKPSACDDCECMFGVFACNNHLYEANM